jgi:phosphatidate cytidylyltransferase
MSAGHHDLHSHAHPNLRAPAPGFRAIRWNMDWITRPLFGVGLALLAIGALFSGPIYFACLVAAMGLLAAFEWHRMVGQGRPFRTEAIATALTVALSVLTLALSNSLAPALVLVAIGALASWALAFRSGQTALWQILGVLYLAVPSLALVVLAARDAWLIIGLFVIVWATDTGALICGNLIGGPRMAPVLSPSKTWAGTIGGSLIASLAFAGFIAWRQGEWLAALPFGFGFSLIAHGGDLFESFVKRRFGIKNSGSLIPGHGGVLDRMDSSLAAALALAVLVFMFGVNPLVGVHS